MVINIHLDQKMEAEEAAPPARTRLDYRGKMILAPMVKVIIDSTYQFLTMSIILNSHNSSLVLFFL